MRTSYLLLTLGLSALSLQSALADEFAEISDSGLNAHGVVSVNQAAGNVNQQANLRSISISQDAAIAITPLTQQNGLTPVPDSAASSARLGANVFAGSQGAIGINQSAGSNNQSANMLSIAIAGKSAYASPAVVQDQLLASTSTAAATSQPSGTSKPAGKLQAEIADTAFQGSRGVVQINQIAGSQNRAVNVLAVQWVSP